MKSEQHFAETSTKRGAVFHTSLKLVREEAGAQLSNNDKICSTSQGSNVYEKEGPVNKMMHSLI